jgi:4-amino-4-deoxy-L-arabinose transferase-like glycosyltransferase
MKNKNTKIYVLLFLIIALGFFLRIYNIEHAPPGVYPDEAVNGEDALTANDSGHYQWFYPANQGREGLFINLQAMSLKYLGTNVLALKLPSIIIGTLTILGIFLLASELFSARVGLLSAFLTSVGFWHLNFSRIGFRAIMLPFILSFAFYFLWKGLRTKKWTAFAAGGFVFGLGLHTYIAFRIAPAILVITLISLVISRPNFLKEYWKKILIFIVFTSISAAPMLWTLYIAHPEYAESRSGSISIFSPQVNQGNLAGTFLKSFGLSLAKYNFVGDMNWRHNYPPYPVLDLLTGTAFLFGLIYSVLTALQFFRRRLLEKIGNPQMDVFVFLLAWFFIMLAPEFLTAEGNPHALRAIGTIPVVFIFSGLAFDWILDKNQKNGWLLKKVYFFLIVAMLFSIGLFNSLKYHIFWAGKIDTARSFEKVLMDVSGFIQTLPPQTEKFIITGSMQRVPIKVFNWQMPNLHFFYPGQVAGINPKSPKNFVIILTERNDEAVAELQRKFPALTLSETRDPLGVSYYIFK